MADGVDQDCDGYEICYLDADNDGSVIDDVAGMLLNGGGKKGGMGGLLSGLLGRR